MVRVLCFIIIGFSLINCSKKNEYGRKRFDGNFYKTDVNPVVYTMVDTSKIYQIVSGVSLPDNKPLTSLNKTYLKFYGNGRAGTFFSYNPKDPGSLDPKKADIAYYRYKDGGIELETFFEHVQGGGWVKDKMVASGNTDTLSFVSDKILTKYKKLDLPKEFLIYKPDW